MDDPNELVLLCTCIDGMQAHAVRASLEARGIRVFVADQQTNDVLGFVYAGLTPPRVMVPMADLATARVIAEDLMGPLEGLPELEEGEEVPGDPMRPIPEDELEDEEEDEGDEDDDEAVADRPPPKRKSIAIPLLLGFLGLSLGLSHIYAGRGTTGLALITLAVFGLALTLGGNWFGTVIVGGVWLFDVIGGIVGVLAHNRALDQTAPPR